MGRPKIVIVTDSSAYIPDAALEGLNVSVIPLWLLWDNERLQDGVDIDPPAFYRRLRASKTLPSSSQPSPKEFEEFFREVAKEADAIVSVLASSKLSGTVASAEAAQAELTDLPVRVVDSLSSSMGQGFIVLAAARAAAAGKTLDEVVAAAEAMRERMHFLFVVDTLEYLHRGGRIGGAKRLLGTALSIKPLLQFRDGQIEPLSQARTKPRAITRLLEVIEERLGGKAMAAACVVDIDAPDDGYAVAELLRARFAPPTLYRSTVSPVVGTHVGPGALGVAFYTEA